jgi:hypothetical protein
MVKDHLRTRVAVFFFKDYSSVAGEHARHTKKEATLKSVASFCVHRKAGVELRSWTDDKQPA